MNAFSELLEKIGLKGKGHEEKEPKDEGGFAERMRRLTDVGEAFEGVKEEEIFSSILETDIGNIRHTLEGLDKAAFCTAVDMLQNARNIYILGIRSCEPLADFLGFYLNMMFDNLHVIRTSSASEIFEQMLHIGPGDVLVGISFPRYSMRTLKAMEFANSRSAGVIAITDHIHSPMNLYSSCNLLAESQMASIVDSLTAPLSVINALVVALAVRRQAQMKESLQSMEEIWQDYQFYGNDEIDQPAEGVEIWQRGENKHE
ncbi:MAG: MurR/RpiR family transcriptional regulator [Eubacteriales bacterium]|nr:MurR/RpiR family transcriptional regulator [Eubacteriales bacterium]